MKAVIMAGGKGTRLAPLTCQLPKPMVPILDRPCMEYIIELLKTHGITEIAVTLQYLPNVIKNHFGDGSAWGVHLHYFEETSPLGTAGSVKNAERFLDETFLVISGDGLTDFDLSQAIAFHRSKKALGTLVLTQVDIPLEYGVVMTEADGRISRFLEKPNWSEVFSDTVNTGIYVLEPEILTLFQPQQTFDFSKDLFPLLLKNNLPLYGSVLDGYWSDIGNLTQYRQTQFDILNGKVNVSIKGLEVQSGIWVGRNVIVHRGVRISGPLFIGDGTILESGSDIGPYAVIGRYNRVDQGVALERTVVWNRNFIGKASSLSGVTLCHGSRIGAGVTLSEQAVVGDQCRVGDLAVIKPKVKIWPEKVIGASTIVPTSLVWGNTASPSLFGPEGIQRLSNLEIHPEWAGRLGSAYGSCLPRGAKVILSSDDEPFSEILKSALTASLLASGIHVRDIGRMLAPIARFACRSMGYDGGIHIHKADEEVQRNTVLKFFDHEGLPIAKDLERKIENAFWQEDFARPDLSGLGHIDQSPYDSAAYIQAILSSIDLDRIRSRAFKLVLDGEKPAILSQLQKTLENLGCYVLNVRDAGYTLADNVRTQQADFGVRLDASGRRLSLYTEHGNALTEKEILLFQVLVNLDTKSPVAIPVTASAVVEKLIRDAGLTAVRTKTGSRDLLEVGKHNPLQVYDDGLYFLARTLHYLASEQKTLQRVVEELPGVHMHTDFVTCPIEAKGRVMRQLMQEMKGENLELIDGIKVTGDNDWALIMPDIENAFFKIVTEGSTERKARELARLYRQKITLYQRERDDVG